ncbi:Clr5 domain-containing protein [Xylaria arbuscula]|nr:Clr5 domain-containing protein [Xylaria arbuscula]
MALNDPKIPWAQPEGWINHRPIITELYLDQMMRLDDVKEIMERKYDFHATIKMYKTRFRRWGLMKNKKSTPAMKRRLAVITKLSQTPQMIQTLPPPEFYKKPEDAFRFIQVYFTTVRFRDREPSDTAITVVLVPVTAEWAGYLATVKCLFSLGRHKEAFQIVDMCCHRYKFVLKSQDLSLPDITVRALVTLSGLDTNLVDMFFRFIYKMSQIVLGPLHPFSTLLSKIKQAGVDNLVYCINASFQHYVRSLVYIRPHPMVLSYGDYLRDLIDNKFLNAGHMHRQLLPFEHDLLNPKPQAEVPNQSYSIELNQVLRSRIAWLKFYTGRYDEAKKLISGILDDPLADSRVISGCGCYDILHEVSVVEKRHELALEALQNAVTTSVKGYGYGHCVTARSMAALEAYLRSTDRLEEAEKVHRDSETQIEQICDEVRRLWL